MSMREKIVTLVIGWFFLSGIPLGGMASQNRRAVFSHELACLNLMKGILSEDLAAVKKAIEDGTDIEFSRIYSFSPLEFAIGMSTLAMVKYLVEKQRVDIERSSVLTIAITSDRLDIVRYLVENRNVVPKKSDYYHINKKPQMLFYFASINNYREKSIIDESWPVNYFCLAAHKGDILQMRELIKDSRSYLNAEDRKSLMIALGNDWNPVSNTNIAERIFTFLGFDREKNRVNLKEKAFDELLFLFSWNQHELFEIKQHISLDGKRLMNSFMQKCALVRMRDQFSNVSFRFA
jgi:hypothetical protein